MSEHPKLIEAWKNRVRTLEHAVAINIKSGQLFSNGVKLQKEGEQSLALGERNCVESWLKWARGNKLVADGKLLRAEGEKLSAEAKKLTAEADIAWLEAIIEVYGDVNLSLSDLHCTLTIKQYFKTSP